MAKEGEGKVDVRTPLQRATGQGKEGATGQGKDRIEIKYPMPTPFTLAFIEEEFGSLEAIRKDAQRHAYRMTLMLVFYLEMQKDDREDEVAMMTIKERRGAASRLLKEKNIDLLTGFPARAKVAMEVFISAQGASRAR